MVHLVLRSFKKDTNLVITGKNGLRWSSVYRNVAFDPSMLVSINKNMNEQEYTKSRIALSSIGNTRQVYLHMTHNCKYDSAY